MKRWMATIALGVAVGAGLAYFFTTRQSQQFRRQLTKQAQTWRKQSERTINRLSNQVQEGAQDVIGNTRQFARRTTNKLIS
ncbi:MAG TPA: YtxH domain-containing protein [Ktedonobacterales bacterium]|jgi:gas vesicle protein